MNARNCRKCGRVFNYVMGPVMCPRCREALEEKFQEVKKYVQDHPGSDIMEVSEECDVDPSQIRQWIREDRLQFADDSPIRIPCESCGTMIKSGRFCEKCKREMSNEFNHAIGKDKPKVAAAQPAPKKSERDRMRFL